MRSFLKFSSTLLLSAFALCSIAFADVAPDPGYTRVSANLILESDADLSAYRFFLESPMRVDEVKINSGGPTLIEAAGRGGAAQFGRLIAVPVSETNSISGDLSGPLLESFIREKRFPNAKELLSHNFQATIPIVEKASWQDPVYRISIADGVISASPVSGGSSGNAKLTYSVWQFVWPVAVAGLLLAAGIAVMGVWLIRGKGKIV